MQVNMKANVDDRLLKAITTCDATVSQKRDIIDLLIKYLEEVKEKLNA